jgi:hypothetical protein
MGCDGEGDDEKEVIGRQLFRITMEMDVLDQI